MTSIMPPRPTDAMDYVGPWAPHALITDAQLATIIDDDAGALRESHELLTIWIAPDAVLTPTLQFDHASGRCELSPVIAALLTEASRVPGSNPHCEVYRWLTAPTAPAAGLHGLPPYLTLHTDPDRLVQAFAHDQAARRELLEIDDSRAHSDDPAVPFAAKVAEPTSLAAAVLAVSDGPFWTHPGIRSVLGLGAAETDTMRDDRRILACPVGPTGFVYPDFQLVDHRRLDERLAPMMQHLRQVPAWDVTLWFVSPQPLLDGATPLAWIRGGGDEAQVLAAAEGLFVPTSLLA